MLIGAVAVLPFAYFSDSVDPAGAPRLLLLQLVVLAGSTAMWRREAWRAFSPGIRWALAGLAATGALSILSAIDRHAAVLAWGRLLTMIQLFFLPGALSYPARTARLLAPTAAVTGAGLSLIACFQTLHGDVLPYAQIFPPAATFLSKNVAGGFLTGLVFPAIAWLLLERRAYWQPLAWLCNSLIFFFLAMTESRASWLATGLGLTFMAAFLAMRRREMSLWNLRRHGVAVGIALTVAAGLILSVNHARNPVHASLAEEARSLLRWGAYDNGGLNTVAIRLAMYANALPILAEHPLTGVGLGNFRVHYPRFHNRLAATPTYAMRTTPERLHNDPLQWTVETGLLGGGALLALAFLIFARPVVSQNDEDYLIQSAFKFGALAIFMESCASFSLQMNGSAALFWLWAGFATARPKPESRGGGSVASALVLCLNLWLLYLFFLSLASTVFHKQAHRQIERGESIQALQSLERAAAIFPSNWTTLDQSSALAIGLGEWGRGRAATRQFLKRNPFHPNGHYRMALIYFAEKRFDEAHNALSVAAEYSGPSWEIQYLLSLTHLKMGQTEAAVQAFANAQRLRPDLTPPPGLPALRK